MLDPDTEARIVATLRGLAGPVTILSISHQPAMQREADVLYRFDGGGAVVCLPSSDLAGDQQRCAPAAVPVRTSTNGGSGHRYSGVG